jgi:hypothetical protein
MGMSRNRLSGKSRLWQGVTKARSITGGEKIIPRPNPTYSVFSPGGVPSPPNIPQEDNHSWEYGGYLGLLGTLFLPRV